MKATIKAMLEVIDAAGFTVEIQADGGTVTVTATDDTGETWRVSAGDELAAVAELAAMLDFEDLT